MRQEVDKTKITVLENKLREINHENYLKFEQSKNNLISEDYNSNKLPEQTKVKFEKNKAKDILIKKNIKRLYNDSKHSCSSTDFLDLKYSHLNNIMKNTNTCEKYQPLIVNNEETNKVSSINGCNAVDGVDIDADIKTHTGIIKRRIKGFSFEKQQPRYKRKMYLLILFIKIIYYNNVIILERQREKIQLK